MLGCKTLNGDRENTILSYLKDEKRKKEKSSHWSSYIMSFLQLTAGHRASFESNGPYHLLITYVLIVLADPKRYFDPR